MLICVTRRLSHHDYGLLFHVKRIALWSQGHACKEKWAGNLLDSEREDRVEGCGRGGAAKRLL